MARRAPVVVRDRSPGLFPTAALEGMNHLVNEHFEMPGGGAMGTARDRKTSDARFETIRVRADSGNLDQ